MVMSCQLLYHQEGKTFDWGRGNGHALLSQGFGVQIWSVPYKIMLEFICGKRNLPLVIFLGRGATKIRVVTQIIR